MTAVRRAVILAAGLGTRMLPATKAVPKELLPVVDRPLIQYAVEEAVAAGIDQVVFVVAPGKEAIAAHFGTETRADAHARASGDEALIEAVCGVAGLARYAFVNQDEAKGIAHAVACARDLIAGEPFALMFPDDLITAARPCIGQLIEAHEETGGTVIGVQEVRRAEIPQYGIVSPAGDGNPFPLRAVVEKPRPEEAPSNLGIVGRYVFGASIMAHIGRIPPGRGGELQITDAIASQIGAGEPVHAYRYEGVRFDTGRPLGYLVANVAMALRRPGLGEELRPQLAALLQEAGRER